MPAKTAFLAQKSALLRSIGGLGFAVWVLGSGWLLLRLVYGLAQLARLRRKAVPVSKQIARIAEESATEIGLRHAPPIYSSNKVSSPWAAGILKPYILLPFPAFEALTPQQQREVFLHEFAHILRRDLWIGLAQRLSIVAFWPSPLVHWLNAILSSSREDVCDNYVLSRTNPAGYAETLLQVAAGVQSNSR